MGTCWRLTLPWFLDWSACSFGSERAWECWSESLRGRQTRRGTQIPVQRWREFELRRGRQRGIAFHCQCWTLRG